MVCLCKIKHASQCNSQINIVPIWRVAQEATSERATFAFMIANENAIGVACVNRRLTCSARNYAGRTAQADGTDCDCSDVDVAMAVLSKPLSMRFGWMNEPWPVGGIERESSVSWSIRRWLSKGRSQPLRCKPMRYELKGVS